MKGSTCCTAETGRIRVLAAQVAGDAESEPRPLLIIRVNCLVCALNLVGSIFLNERLVLCYPTSAGVATFAHLFSSQPIANLLMGEPGSSEGSLRHPPQPLIAFRTGPRTLGNRNGSTGNSNFNMLFKTRLDLLVFSRVNLLNVSPTCTC